MREWLLRMKKLSGTEKYVILIQIASLFPLLYVLIGAGSNVYHMQKSFFSVIFELGMAFLSRAEVFCLSLFYRVSLNELYVYFVILILALVFGLVMKRLLRGSEKTGKAIRLVLIIWIICDIIVRLLPLRVNTIQEPVFRILGLVFRIICLLLVGLDVLKKRR